MNDKFEMFNDMRIDEDKYDKVILTKDEKDNMKSRMKVSVSKRSVIRKKFVTVASVGVIVIGGLVFTSEITWAYIENIGRQIEMFLNKDSNEFEGYKVLVNQEVINNGIKITLKELMLDDGQMILSINLDTKEFDYSKLGEGLNENNTTIDLSLPKIIIGDLIYSGTTCSIDARENEDKTEDILIRSALDMIDTNNDGAPDKDYPILENIDSNLDYNVRVVFDEFSYRKTETNNKGSVSHTTSTGKIVKFEEDSGEVVESSPSENNKENTGIWEFEATINGAKIMENIDLYTLNKDIEINYKDYDGVLTIDNIRVSPVSAKIKYRYKSNVNMYQKGHQAPPYIHVLDEKDEMIAGSGSGTGDEYNHEFIKEVDLSGKEKSIVIEVYVDDEEKIKYIEDSEIKIDLNK